MVRSCHSIPPFSLSVFLRSHSSMISPRGILDDSHACTHTHTHSVPWVMQWVIEYSNLSLPASLASSYSDLDALQWSRVSFHFVFICTFACVSPCTHKSVCIVSVYVRWRVWTWTPNPGLWLLCVYVCLCAASVSLRGEAGRRRSRDKSGTTHSTECRSRGVACFNWSGERKESV